MTLQGLGHTPLFNYPLYSVCLVCVCVMIQCCEVVGDNHSPALIYVRQWDIVVLDRHLVLLVLAVLVVCIGYMCVGMVLDRHLVL